MSIITLDEKLAEITPEEFFESQAQTAMVLQDFSSKLKEALDRIDINITKKKLNDLWGKSERGDVPGEGFVQDLIDLYEQIHEAYELSQFEQFFRVILVGTDYKPSDFEFDIDGLLLIYRNQTQKTVPDEQSFAMRRFFERSKGILSTIQKDALSYTTVQRFVYDLLGGTAIIGHKDVPQFDFEAIYKSGDIDSLKHIINKDRDKLGFDDVFMDELLSKEDFNELFSNFMLSYKLEFEQKNRDAVRDFMLFQQKSLGHVIPIYPQKYEYVSGPRYSQFEGSSQRFVDSSILREREEYEEDFMSRVLVFDIADLADKFFEDVKRKAEENFSGKFYKRGEDFEQEPYKAIFYEKDGQYFCLVKPLQKKGVVLVHSGKKAMDVYSKISDFKRACQVFVDGFMEHKLEARINGERFPEITKPDLSSISYLYMEGEIPGAHIIEPLTSEHTESDRKRFLDDFMFLNGGEEELGLSMSEDIPKFWGKDFSKRAKQTTYEAMHLRFDNRVELRAETEVQRWNYEYGEASHADYEREDKDIRRIRKKIYGAQMKKVPKSMKKKQLEAKQKQLDKCLRIFFNRIRSKVRNRHLERIERKASEVNEDYRESTLLNIINLEKLKYQFERSEAMIRKARNYILDMPRNYLRNQGINVFDEDQREGLVHITNALELVGLIARNVKGIVEEELPSSSFLTKCANGVYIQGLLKKAEECLKADDTTRNLYGVGILSYAPEARNNFGADGVLSDDDKEIRSMIASLNHLVEGLDTERIKTELDKLRRKQIRDLVKGDFSGKDDYLDGIAEGIKVYVNDVCKKSYNGRDFGAPIREG